MSMEQDKLKELNAQINLKLAEGKIEEAERLSVSLIENAMGIDPRQNGPKEMLSGMLSKFMATVHQVQAPAMPTAEQIEAIKEAAVNDEHLRLLSIFHYVNAAISALCSCVFLIYLGFGAVMLLNPALFATPGQPQPDGVGWIFLFVGLIPLILGLIYSGVNVFAGYCIKHRARRDFCLTIAGINCLNVPFGITLGILTILVLSREKVKAKFRTSHLAAG